MDLYFKKTDSSELMQTKIYFPNLNGLRFFAAFLVIVSHIEGAKHYAGYDNYMHYPFFSAVGTLSVTLFFVLSGFLITYLLLHEKQNTGNTAIKEFYIKRILRIWPLYFLVIIITLFIIQKADPLYLPEIRENNLNKLELYQLFLLIIIPNLVTTFFFLPFLGHIWSIGVEEQFYLAWPWIIKFTRNHLKSFFIILIVALVISLTLYLAKNTTSNPAILQYIEGIKSCFSQLRISCMTIGGIGAWVLFYKKEKLLNLIYRKELQWGVILLTLILFLINPGIPFIKHEFYSLLFCIIIVNLASNPQPVLNLENNVFSFLGKISYGIYMYHPLIIAICLGVLQKIGTFDNLLFNLILYSMILSTTFIISAVSYYIFEKGFLKLKRPIYTVLPSA